MMACKYEGTGHLTGRCIGTYEVDPCRGYDKCEAYSPNYITIADRIRAMSDEELAVLHVGMLILALNEAGINVTDDVAEAAKKDALKRLKQPAEDTK